MNHELRSLLIGIVLIFVSLALVCSNTLNLLQKDEFNPIELPALDVEPKILTIGQPAIFYDGLCNNSDDSLVVQMYLGLQSVGGSIFNQDTVDLLRTKEGVPVKDTPEGRLRKTLEPGCLYREPIDVPIVPTIQTGVWKLRVHILATGPNGEIQDLTKTSKPFEIKEP